MLAAFANVFAALSNGSQNAAGEGSRKNLYENQIKTNEYGSPQNIEIETFFTDVIT
jgi:hypothetical protein